MNAEFGSPGELLRLETDGCSRKPASVKICYLIFKVDIFKCSVFFNWKKLPTWLPHLATGLESAVFGFKAEFHIHVQVMLF